LTAALLAPSAFAGTPSWLGTVSNDWFTAGNWSPAAVPTAGDIGVTVDTNSPNPAVINGGAAAGQQIFVGSIGSGSLTIQNGGVLNSTTGTLGNFQNGNGTVSVTGTNSAWHNSADLTVGNLGTGTLTISTGGAVTNVNAKLGSSAGATGNVTVNGTNANWASSGDVRIGDLGSGNLTISGGGTASAANVYLAYGAGSTGSATVTGIGSTWNAGNNLLVGFGGTGSLTIAQGGHVTDSTGAIGNSAGANGTASVDGTNSVRDNSTALFVGGASAGQLTVSNGGQVNNNVTRMGSYAGITGSIIVDGAGSALVNSTVINLGEFGTGNLTVRNGGAVSTAQFVEGLNAGASGVIKIDGAGSSLSASASLNYVGYSGTGALTVSNGGTFTGVGLMWLGYNAGSSGSLSVDGAGSHVTLAGSSGLVVGSLGSGTLAISNGGTVSNFTGAIAGGAGSTGAVTVSGAGSSWIVADTLNIADSGTGTLTISSGGHVSDNVAIVGNHGGTGTVVLDGAGSTWTAGGLYVGVAGNGSVSLAHGGAASGTFAVIGYLSTGSMSVDGAGSRWTGSTDLTLGYLSGGHGTLSVSNGATFNNAFAFIGYAAGSTGAVTIDGAGTVWTNSGTFNVGESGTGTVTLSNNATANALAVHIAHQSGSTGTLNIGAAAGSAPVGEGVLNTQAILFGAGNGTINFNHTSSNYVFAADIYGSGTINQLAGTTTLSGGGMFMGQTNVSGGTLWVDGAFGSSTANVTSGGTLGGVGTIGDVTVNGGTLVAGRSGGTLSVQGSLVLTSAATYLVQVNGATAGQTAVNGTATLAGNVQVQLLGRVGATTTYTILTSAATSGTFDGVSISGSGLARNARLSYVGNSVLLTLDPGLLSPSLPGNANINQRNVAGGIDNALLAGGNPPTGFNALFNLTGANLGAALTQASGETATGAQQTTFSAMSQFMGTLLDPFIGGRAGAPAPAGSASFYAEEGAAARTGAARDAFAALYDKAPMARNYDPRWSVWAAAFGGSQTTDGNTALGSSATTSRLFGTVAGADYRLTPDTVAGFALAGGGTSFSVAGAGTGRSDLFQAGVFLRHTMGPSYLSAALAYGWQDVTTNRNVTIAGLDQLQARFAANAYSGRIEGGRRFVAPWLGFGVTPYAAAQVTSFELPAYAESVVSGTNTFALSYGAKRATDTRTELGLRTDRSYALADGVLTLRGRAAWSHDFNPDRSVAATFQTLPGGSFVVNGAAQASDSALSSLSAEFKWINGWSAAATFESEYSAVTRSYAGKAALRYAW
jgi:T5SS/PEP-CTERM-associated repeat protein